MVIVLMWRNSVYLYEKPYFPHFIWDQLKNIQMSIWETLIYPHCLLFLMTPSFQNWFSQSGLWNCHNLMCTNPFCFILVLILLVASILTSVITSLLLNHIVFLEFKTIHSFSICYTIACTSPSSVSLKFLFPTLSVLVVFLSLL
jgi:hypothetical protein